jgi:FkbM family methyltransferase
MNYLGIKRFGHWQKIVTTQGLLFTVLQLVRRLTGNQAFRRYGVALDGTKHWLLARVGTSDTGIYDQVFCRAEYSCVNALDVQPSSIVDAGANVGFSTVYFRKCFPESKIVSIEPDDENYRMLVDNTTRLMNIVPVCGAVWGETCTLSMAQESFRDGSACAKTVSLNPGNISAFSIGDVISTYDLQVPIMVKIDIEGAETNVFCQQRADSWLPIVDVVLIEVHEDSVFGDPTKDLESSMLRHGFSYIMSGEVRMYTRVKD